jgi:hypothetical protein
MEKLTGKIAGILTPDKMSNVSLIIIEDMNNTRMLVPVEKRYLEEIIDSEACGDVYNLAGRKVEVKDGFIYFL